MTQKWVEADMGGEDEHVGPLLKAYRQCRTKLAWRMMRIVGPHQVEDILQEAFVRSMEAARVTQIQHPAAFLMQTARNLALNHVSSADQRMTDRLEDFAFPEVHAASSSKLVETEVEAKERFLLFCRALRRVPVKCRRVFILKKVYGCSQKEIATLLCISQSTVEKQVAKGLQLCRDYMEAMERGVIQDEEAVDLESAADE